MDLLLDFGNSTLKILKPGEQPRAIVASMARLTPEQADHFEAFSDENVLIRQTGENETNTLWGEYANMFKGRLNSQVDKLERLTNDLTPGYLAALDRSHNGKSVKVYVSVPDVNAFRKTYRDWEKTTTGRYVFKRNGEMFNVNITDVVLVNESFGSFVIAKESGKVPTGSATVIVDIGAGTVNISVYAPNGSQIARSVHDGLGVSALGALIAKDENVIKTIKTEGHGKPQISQILMGIGSGTYEYGHSGISLKDALEENFPAWGKKISEAVQRHKEAVAGMSKTLIWTGGGSELVRTFSDKQRSNVLDGALFANVVGMSKALEAK